MYLKRLLALTAIATVISVSACDKDPSAPNENFDLVACPTGDLLVNSPITLTFTAGVRPSTVSLANVVVTNATTGFEIPGGLALSPNGTQVVFSPNAPLPFGTVLGIRIQNLLSASGFTPMAVRVCTARTEPPPIAEVVWDRLDSPTGTQLLGASLYAADSGWVASFAVPLYRRVGAGWEVRFNQPYFASTYDAAFVSGGHGWGAHLDQRNSRSVITQTKNGFIFDTSFAVGGQDIRRLRIDSLNSFGKLFGAAGGGSAFNAQFFKLNPTTGGFASAGSFGFTSSVSDIDFSKDDTTTVFATTSGARFINGSVNPGRLYRSVNGGVSWSEVAGAQADTAATITYKGVARRQNQDVFVTGGNGFVARFVGGNLPFARINLGILSRDTTDFQALIYNDVQFAPDNDQIGFIVGAELTGFVQGVPSYRGLIFRTTDGGASWVRQGVRGAASYGAEIPALNRISVFSSTKAWIVGDGGYVISLNP